MKRPQPSAARETPEMATRPARITFSPRLSSRSSPLRNVAETAVPIEPKRHLYRGFSCGRARTKGPELWSRSSRIVDDLGARPRPSIRSALPRSFLAPRHLVSSPSTAWKSSAMNAARRPKDHPRQPPRRRVDPEKRGNLSSEAGSAPPASSRSRRCPRRRLLRAGERSVLERLVWLVCAKALASVADLGGTREDDPWTEDAVAWWIAEKGAPLEFLGPTEVNQDSAKAQRAREVGGEARDVFQVRYRVVNANGHSRGSLGGPRREDHRDHGDAMKHPR